MRQNAANWLELADKVWHVRRDVLPAAEAAELSRLRNGLGQMLRDRADAARLKLGIEALEGALRRSGGAVYPKSSLTENIEFLLVAAIVILGIRAYFVQPFKIPTNSMWPTYYGMTAENLKPGTPAPGIAEQAFRLAAFGAERRQAIAPRSGVISAPFFLSDRTLYLAPTLRNGRSWLIFPAVEKEYTFYIDGEPASVRVPEDFNEFEGNVLIPTFFGTRERMMAYLSDQYTHGRFSDKDILVDERTGQSERVLLFPLPATARAGEPVVRFDLMTGDQLFVDRLSYNFMRPRVGQGFVFSTRNIPAIGLDEFYIKRLVGTPGDTLEVRSPVLYRNGSPITGAGAFDLNARRVPPYGGYTYGNSLGSGRYLFQGKTLTVPTGSFFAMGDNSADSSDGRVWGFVPAADVVGRPLFIYYPFTRRWGPAR
ncbi:MAG: signal peptidase I [Opitutaceae bacterium]|jgi:signal peptidase I